MLLQMLEGHTLAQEDAFVSRCIHLLQICSRIDENAVGACSELIFAPIDEMFQDDDAPWMPCSFLTISFDSKPEFCSLVFEDLFSLRECLFVFIFNYKNATLFFVYFLSSKLFSLFPIQIFENRNSENKCHLCNQK